MRDAAGENGPARGLFATLANRLERRKPVPALVSLDSNSEALLILRNHEDSGQGWFWAPTVTANLPI